MHRRLTLLAGAVLAGAVLLGLMRAGHAGSVDNYLKAQMAAQHIPGLSAAVVQDGKIVKEQGYGLSDTAAKTPATAETVYQIGSLTKQFTAAAILTLMQQGKVGIDDPLSKYVDGTPAAWSAITVRELLNQTSGIRNYREALVNSLDAAPKDYTAAQVIAMADAKPLQFKPGTQFAYSNTNYHLLGMIVEKVSGRSYADYMQQTFFGPLGMTQTRMSRPGLALPNLAAGTLWDGKAVQGSSFAFSPTVDFGDGGILSCVADLVKWNAALDGTALLSAESKRLLWTPPTLASGTATQYASGWFAAEAGSHKLLWHNGATIAGFTGAIFKFPGDRLTLIVLTNSLNIPSTRTSIPLYSMGLGLAKLYLPDLAKEDAGIPDTDPQTAALLRLVSAQVASGTLDKSLFTPAFQAALTPEAVNPAHNLLAPLSPLTSLTLLSRDSGGVAVYQAVYGTTVVNWQIAVDKDHKIAGLRPLPQ